MQVLEQADILDAVHAQAVNATENTKVPSDTSASHDNIYPEVIVVQEGNEAVRQAIQNKASYRVYILFILLVFSFRLGIMVKGNL